MAGVTLTPPKQWEDWVSWVLGIWLCLSPWILGFAGDARATQNAVIVGFLLILAEVITLSAFAVWEEWLNVALGAWLIVCSFVLGFSRAAAMANFIVVGLIVAALAFYEMTQVRKAG